MLQCFPNLPSVYFAAALNDFTWGSDVLTGLWYHFHGVSVDLQPVTLVTLTFPYDATMERHAMHSPEPHVQNPLV